jgi:hypothetical protein
MLERQRFLFRKESGSGENGLTSEILDPDTQQHVGVVRECSRMGLGLLRRLFALLVPPTRLAVRETEDESLVFTVTPSFSLFGQEVTVADADDNLVGYIRPGFRGGLWIYDRDRVAFARLSGSWQKKEISIVRPDGLELGMVTMDDSGRSSDSEGKSFIISLDDRLADEPFAKMLLLGAVLGLDLF